MILATRHTGIVAADMDKMLRFWRDRDIMGIEVANFIKKLTADKRALNSVKNKNTVKMSLRLGCVSVMERN